MLLQSSKTLKNFMCNCSCNLSLLHTLCYNKLHFSVKELFEEEMQVKGEVEDVEQVVQQVEERQSPSASSKKALMLCRGKGWKCKTQVMCPGGKEAKACRQQMKQGAVEKRQVMCPEGKRGKKCRKRMLQGE